MEESDGRVQEALAAFLDHLEMGGSPPDTGHLTPSEQARLQELLDALELTEGVAFGLGRRDDDETTAPSVAEPPLAEPGATVLGQLREALPQGVNIVPEATTSGPIGGSAVLGSLVVGTFGGRVRVLILDVDDARTVEENPGCLTDVATVFRMFTDTSAVALVATDMSSMIVRPEDCALKIEVPTGSLVSRRYRRAIEPVGDAVAAFLEELNPYWDPIPTFGSDAVLNIDVASIAQGTARVAIERQVAVGERARKGNPKKEALLGLGHKEMSAISKLAGGLLDGSVTVEDAGARLERLAGDT